MLRVALFSLALTTLPAQAERLTFVALAGVTDKAGYQAFLEQVTPIWERHGMRVVMAADVEGSDTFDHATLLDVDSRAGFRAYLADKDYKAIAPLRLGSVAHLTILEGPHALLPPRLADGTAISLLFQTDCEAEEPGARVSLVGPVKGDAAPYLARTGCVRFVTADDTPTGTVVAGFAATVRR